jgi:N6-adenosine-specific RNA methylase IME4
MVGVTKKPPTSRNPEPPDDGQESRSPRELRGHPEALRVPSMTVLEAKALEADIARRGIVVPLDITVAGVVLDGRHRHRTALNLGLELVPVRIVDPLDEVDYMISAALQRRHLTESQRAAMVLDLREYLEQREQAASRKRANLRNSGLEGTSMSHRAGRSSEYAAKIADVSPSLIKQTESIKRRAPNLLPPIRAGEITVGRALKQIERQERYAHIGPAPALPEGQFDVIYADPPWQLGSPTSANSPEQHYPTLPTREIAELAIPAAEKAVLFLWAVSGLLPDALEVTGAWGFTYKTNFVWVKRGIGLGVYARNQHELLLFATRGGFAPPANDLRTSSVIDAPRGRHSEKPACVYERIEQMYPRATRLELFARGKARHRWTTWGNEATL